MGSGFSRKLCTSAHMRGQVLTSKGKTCSLRTSFTITPIHQAKTIHFPMIPRRFDQALPASSFSRPDARQGRMKSHLHLILLIEVSTWQESEQSSQVGGKLVPQVGFDQV